MQNTKIKIFDSLLARNYAPMPDLTFLGQITTKKIEQLAVKIHQSSWKFNQIVCLARGGLRIGDILARIQAAAGNLATSSYAGPGKQERN